MSLAQVFTIIAMKQSCVEMKLRIDSFSLALLETIIYNTNYKFMQSEHTFIQKTFEFTNESTGQMQTFSLQVLYLPTSRQINMSRAFLSICALGLNLNNCNLFYLDFVRKHHVHMGIFPFKQQLFLKYELFLESAIKIRYRCISADGKTVKNNITTNIQTKKKVKQRTIHQASQYVDHWRQLYQKVDSNGKRLYTLDTAASVIGLAKKTLDDYYYQLRQAHYYGFDFQTHKNDKIGVLRRFVKEAVKNQSLDHFIKQEDEIDRYLASSSDSQEQRRYRQ